ncbi:MAG: hypothetical protein GEU75_06890 [Dehalococcoidia bacterium]|nr:hypothetical protein [Dehalococcoidia bacterium]
MTQESSAEPPAPTTVTPTDLPTETPAVEPAQPDTPPPVRSGGGLPPWLPFLALAIVPALIVGLLVYLFAGSSGGGGISGAGVVDGFIRLGPTGEEEITTFEGELPESFPSDFPVYDGAEVIVAFEIGSPEGTNYFVVIGTGASVDDVYNHYLTALDEAPWQMEIARSGDDFTGMRFSRPDNAEVSGDVTLHHSDLDDQTLLYVSYQDLSQTAQPEAKPFEAGSSRPLPPGFPSDIPIYKGGAESVVLDTYIQKSGGNNNYIVSFLTKDSNVDVVDFYRGEFQKRGWTITDSAAEGSSFAIGIDFNDGQQAEISGTVSADSFADDATYTRVDLLLEVSARRGRGN